MVFSSITFLCYFLPVFLLVYYIVGTAYKNYVLLAFSIFFYSWGAPSFVFILLGSTIVDFYLVQNMHITNEPNRKKRLLILSLSLNLGLLAFFKYSNFFIENVNSFLQHSAGTEVAWTEVLLPIGISFYTFQTLTYSVDVYRGTHPPLKRLSDYLLYIMMFPQMIAGPIIRFNTIAKQITHREINYSDRMMGFYRFMIGLSKKVLIANVMGYKADSVMNSIGVVSLDSSTAWIGLIAYTFQIYFDFSGYSDMAIGIGRMLGFTIPENFNHPYTSSSITEFWKRWHITLGDWMRDYLYIPLGGNRVSALRLYFNLWLVFLLSGLWHGASWNFVLWGVFHGTFLVLDRLFLKRILAIVGRPISIVFTFFIVMLGWVIFRIESVELSLLYYQSLFAFDFGSIIWQADKLFFFTLFLALTFSFMRLIPRLNIHLERAFQANSFSNKDMILSFSFSLILFCLCLGTIASDNFNPFIYFRF